ncbi:VOC family protein [Planococcus halocryophilus]|uniref:Extradiol dioxygenase n=1 Tax=Planococcus halocryophilus TaxID=1215089 RepID=A0A1C7DPQ8_9BACL|nr:VOC family protein [Planococcus halocryophilus]ANU13600.1 extradiol dioxygenase [Planococcus halocryophilus]
MSIQSSHIFVNLPVKNLEKSVSFFQELGFEFENKMTNDDGAALIIGPTSYVMLLTESYFKGFTKKGITDTSSHSEVILTISASSKAKVDELISKALKAGAQPANEKVDDEFMYYASFIDLDGHMWEVLYMEEM